MSPVVTSLWLHRGSQTSAIPHDPQGHQGMHSVPLQKKKTKGPLCSQVVHDNALSAIAKKLVQSHHVLCSVLTTRRGDKELGEDARAAAEAAFAQFFPHFLFFQHCDLGFQELSATQGLPSNSWHSEPFAAMRFAEKPIF